MESNMNPVYKTSAQQKLASKISAHQRKSGMNDLRKLLREKCFIRIKEARRNSFESCRNISNIDIISQIIREEFGEIEKDLALQEEIVKELVENIDAWMIMELEKEENYLIDLGRNIEVLCPICQKYNLNFSQELRGLYICLCGQKITYDGNLKELSCKIEKSVSEHEFKSCGEVLSFFVENRGDQHLLSFLCDECNFYGSI